MAKKPRGIGLLTLCRKNVQTKNEMKMYYIEVKLESPQTKSYKITYRRRLINKVYFENVTKCFVFKTT